MPRKTPCPVVTALLLKEPFSLHEKLREQGIETLSEVKAAYLEGDGQISVIRNSGPPGLAPVTRAKNIPGA